MINLYFLFKRLKIINFLFAINVERIITNSLRRGFMENGRHSFIPQMRPVLKEQTVLGK